jgi:hypothetical protein
MVRVRVAGRHEKIPPFSSDVVGIRNADDRRRGVVDVGP